MEHSGFREYHNDHFFILIPYLITPSFCIFVQKTTVQPPWATFLALLPS